MTIHIDDEQRIGELLGGYEVSGPEVYRAVAAKSETAVETLHEAREALRRFFGDMPVRLSAKPDPDIPGYAPIVAEVLTPRGVTDGFERLKRFDEWWIDVAMKEPAEIIIMTLPQ